MDADEVVEGQDTAQTQVLPKDTVVDTGLEGGELNSTSQSQISTEPVCNHPT